MPFKDPLKKFKYDKSYRLKNHKHIAVHKKLTRILIRLEVLWHYSNKTLECACCKEKTYEFLSIDHKYGGGTKHRKKLGSKYIYSYLVHQGFPKGYRVLCHNCNQAKGFYGSCPHKKRTKDVINYLTRIENELKTYGNLKRMLPKRRINKEQNA